MRIQNLLVERLTRALGDAISEALNEAYTENFKQNGKYYINMDVKMPDGGRTAYKMSDSEFYDKIMDLRKKVLGEQEAEVSKRRLLDTFAELRFKDDKPLVKLNNDLKKIKHDLENCDPIGELRHHDGLPYILMRAGGDWEYEVCYMVYHDGSNFRGYIPEHGNLYNRDTMTALGNDDDSDLKYVYKSLKKYISDDYDEELTMHAMKKLSFIQDEVIEDFEKRVTVKTKK